MRRLIATAFALSLLAACGGASPRVADPSDDEVVRMEEMRITAARTEDGEYVFDSYDAGQLFEEGTRLLNAGRCRDAVERYYDRIRDEFPSSRYLPVAMYNGGLCLQQGGELEAAIPYYREVLERDAASRDGRHAALQLTQVLVRLERWEEALERSERLLLREDLEAPERLEGLARRAQALLGLERLDDARRQARDAMSYYRMQQRTGQIADPYFAAAANFVLAESMRLSSEEIELPRGTAQTQHEALDRRARLMLDAQREYFNTIRHTDAHWAAAAGYRIGAMYDQLWHALMRAPIPPPQRELAEADMPVYEEEYRHELADHVRPLMRHAIRYWELTLMMVERTGVETEWAERAQEDLERMRTLLLEDTDPETEDEGAAESGEPQASEGEGEPQAVLQLPTSLRAGPGARTRAALAVARAPTRPAPRLSALALAR
ncbi:MAG TPA: hypothetical protein RMH99_17925 [Sandaracinaceae bacterium LLY-WYZ-13_1]|nr:hypothetical protein [Sandaracinaceae bacterium LLY-WYZ-13_1]